jgi:predicted nuclease with TOPRIM domain
MMSPETIEKLLLILVPAIVTGVTTYVFTRPKQNAEIGGIHATTDSLYYKMAIEMQEKLPVWIDRYEKETEEKTELRGLLRFAEGEMHRLSRELKSCTNDKSECRKIIESAQDIFSRFEAVLSEMVEHAALLTELKEFRRRLDSL